MNDQECFCGKSEEEISVLLRFLLKLKGCDFKVINTEDQYNCFLSREMVYNSPLIRELLEVLLIIKFYLSLVLNFNFTAFWPKELIYLIF